MKTITYKNYTIEFNFYCMNEYSIYFNGDDFIFYSLQDAKNFIDELENEAL